MWLACSSLSPVPSLDTPLYSFHRLQKGLPHPFQKTNCPVNNTEARARASHSSPGMCSTSDCYQPWGHQRHIPGRKDCRSGGYPRTFLGGRSSLSLSRVQHQGQRQRPPRRPRSLGMENFVCLQLYGYYIHIWVCIIIYTRIIIIIHVRKVNKIFYVWNKAGLKAF